MPNKHAALRAKIEKWLEAEGILFKQVGDLNSFFHILANLKNMQIHIHESKVRRGCLIVQGVLALSPDQLSRVEKISPEDKRGLFLSLFYLLDKSEYHFMIQEDFASQAWLKIQR